MSVKDQDAKIPEGRKVGNRVEEKEGMDKEGYWRQSRIVKKGLAE